MLWFKNLMVYRLSRDIELRAEEMEKQLAELTQKVEEVLRQSSPGNGRSGSR